MVDSSLCVRGPFSQVEETLRRKVAQFPRHYKYIKIGATSNPRRRERAHQRNGWVELITLWRTTSYEKAKEAEEMLIDWEWDRAENEIDGGGGLSPDKEEYFVYVIVA